MLLSKRIIKRYYKTLRTTEKNLQSIFDKRWERHISYKNLKQSSTDRPTHQVINRIGANYFQKMNDNIYNGITMKWQDKQKLTRVSELNNQNIMYMSKEN